jgi:hypothetical protein
VPGQPSDRIRMPVLHKAVTVVRNLMKQLQFLIILFFGVFALMCKTSQSFIKNKREKTIFLSEISNPKILFLLKNNDTLKFSNNDVINEIEYFIKREINSVGYLVSKDLSGISQTLNKKISDTIVLQNQSAIDSKKLSGNLDNWIARELLLKGRGEVCRHQDTQRISMLKYVYTKDKLGGQQGTFFTENGQEVFSTGISLGE